MPQEPAARTPGGRLSFAHSTIPGPKLPTSSRRRPVPLRFPSLDLLARNALAVLRRFPWTLAVGALAAFAAIVGSLSGTDEAWERLAFVAALGLPLTIALTLLGETRGWASGIRHLVVLGGAAGDWPRSS